jgi:uncharacterized protein YfcZ (UPF0381/DUF406 family)
MQYWQKEELQAELEELMDRARELDAPTSINDKIEEVLDALADVVPTADNEEDE